jgi:hypothetical protein
MQLGSLVVSYITSPLMTWAVMLALLSVHLSLNYAAVRSVSMHSLNRQRATILFAHLLAYNKVLRPRDVAKHERIFELDGALRSSNDQLIGSGRVGASLEEVARGLASAEGQPGRAKSALVESAKLDRLLAIFKDEDYIIWFDSKMREALIVLKKAATPSSQLRAWCHAVHVAGEVTSGTNGVNTAATILELIASSLKHTSKVFDDRRQDLIAAGWTLDIALLEVQPGVRLVCMR